MSAAAVVGLFVVLLSAVRSSDSQVDGIPAAAIADRLPGPWISELFNRALANFTVRNVGNSACRTQSAMYDRQLLNHTSWAVRSELYIFFIVYIVPRLFFVFTLYNAKILYNVF